MRTGTRRPGKGFWKGFVSGLVLAGMVTGALALVFPPVRYMPPEVSGAAIVAPEAVAGPGAGARVRTPEPGGLLVAPPAPLIVESPGKILALEAPALAAPAGSEPGGGQPSLVPPTGQ